MSCGNITVAEEAGIVKITLDRPEKLNSFVGHMRRDLGDELDRAAREPKVRVVIIAGAGPAFCAGGDVATMAELLERRDEQEFARMLGAGRRVVTTIRQMTKPVIASIRGVAAGAGVNLALACDLRIAAESASFSQSFVRVGLHPDWGGTYFLPRIVPPNIACELFFLGDAVDSQQALRLGLVNRVVSDEELEKETHQLAVRLCEAPAESIAAAKHAVYMSSQAGLHEMLQYETEAQLRCFRSADAREGIRAFLEKRRPRFNGRHAR